MTFKDFFGKQSIKSKDLGTKKRHMHPILRDVSSHSKHPGRVVPHMHRAKVNNNKVERLKKVNTGRYTINKNDLVQIEKEYNLKYDLKTPKALGNTGIILKHDPVLGVPVIEKK